MKKNEIKKLRLSRETLQDLKSADARRVGGGFTPQSNCLPEAGAPYAQVDACYQV